MNAPDTTVIDQAPTLAQSTSTIERPAVDVGSPRAPTSNARPRVAGKFLWRGDEKLYLRGVTYGTFSPNIAGEPFPEPDVVEGDFADMRASGLNTVRVYTPPPRWLLDAAQRHDLLVLVGLPWEQHVTFLDDRSRVQRIQRDVGATVRELAGHPAILGYAIGNEIPADIVRWYGRRRVERFLERLARAVRAEDPEGLVTYVNFPTTEYLRLPFLDFVAFNVYLERREDLERYLARLQNLTEDKPLVMAEVGLDSRRNGCDLQADTIAWQIEATFEAGCAGMYVFAWTDAWHRGGLDIDDWDFGLVTRDRHPKPALGSVRDAFADVPFGLRHAWPRVTVAICSYNGARTIADALDGATQLDYPDYEIIVVDDGSSDATAEIAARYPGVRLIRTTNRGLSAARNEAWRSATGEIVAYTDDDARPDPHWLRYLVRSIDTHDLAGAGGPNIAPPGDGLIAACVANAPGGPMHVLTDDVTAEHVPGCNMAFRRSVLEEVGGFDPRFRAAGDDVDLCWRIQDLGYRIGFSPAAMVWHHRRNELATYWRQQQGYGKAEALLEAKWPEKYNELGHLAWRGRIYGPGQVVTLARTRGAVFHGTWGLAPFQSLYSGLPGSGPLAIATAPEWHLLGISLLGLTLLAPLWPAALAVLPFFAIVAGVPLIQAILGAARARFAEPASDQRDVLIRWFATAWLHWIQPFARLKGRIDHGLTPWRRRSTDVRASPLSFTTTIWSEQWRARDGWLEVLQTQLQVQRAVVHRGGDFDPWDLEVRGGMFGGVRMAVAVEEHGQGRQLLRFAVRPRMTSLAVWPLAFAVVAAAASASAALLAGLILSLAAASGLWLTYRDLSYAAGTFTSAVKKLREKAEYPR
jgi:O-antigen biosynthesis protein